MARPREFNRDEVLDRAIQLFSIKGYEATSIRELIDTMGVSSSSLYEVFGDKRGIFLAALERYCKFEREQLTQIASETATPNFFIERLFTSMEDVIAPHSTAQRSLSFNTMVELGTRDAEVSRLLLEHYAGIAEIIAAVLSEAQNKGLITSQETPLDLAYTILSALHGLATVKSIQPEFAHSAAITRLILKLLNP